MKPSFRIISSVVVAIGILGALLWAWIVFSPTPPPRQYAIDYLTVAGSLGDAKDFVARQLNARRTSGKSFSELDQLSPKQVAEAIEKSRNLVQQVAIRQDGAIEIRANMAPKEIVSLSNGGASCTNVYFVFVPSLGSSGTIEWHCFGRPVEALPSTCNLASN